MELPYYLSQFLVTPTGASTLDAWCQHTSLVLAELLAMYGVPTRQIHAKNIQHEFIEYYDGKKWVAFDPYFGIRYVRNDQRLGVAEINAAGFDQVLVETPVQKHTFLLSFAHLQQSGSAHAWSSASTCSRGSQHSR